MSTLQERFEMCNSRLLQERVSQAMAEANKTAKLNVAVAAIVQDTVATSADNVTDEEIVAYVSSIT